MLAITVHTETGHDHVRATVSELAELVRRIGDDGDRFLVVERIPDVADVYIQVWHETGSGYALERRDGSPDQHFAVMLDEPDTVVAVMTHWARQQDGWDRDLPWRHIRIDAPEVTDTADETDPERVTRAFAALEAAGITARQNFTCCQTCGDAEIRAVGSPDARGFAYFHAQCAEAATAGGPLMIYYGTFNGSPEATVSIGREVASSLKAAGLPVRWDGDPRQAIQVTPVRWHG